MEFFEVLLVIYISVVSFISFVAVMYDKLAAVRRKRRIPEKTFFILSLLGGSVAVYISMGIFNHKTQKNKFVFLIPLIFFSQCALIYLLNKFIF